MVLRHTPSNTATYVQSQKNRRYRKISQAGAQMAQKRPMKKPSRKDRKQTEAQELYGLRDSVSKLEKSIKTTSALEVAEKYKQFSELPLSHRTKLGLDGAHYVEMTEIQRLAIPTALTGQDILGAAETGSGKTLAFLIPVLERLNMEGWGPQDGLGALVLAPTRELAIQIFQVLRKIGMKHTLSAGLIIGGKDLRQEREAIVRMNILVATPGRLLQHMDQSVGFEWGNLKLLVLDEADRILDLGFAKTLDAIVRSLPPRQTLLFSATQTASLQTLARLSLSNPVTLMSSSLRSLTRPISETNESQEMSILKTPESLTQHVLFTALSDKMDHLWSFVKGHLTEKIIVFVSSCKQVRFVYETFCRLQPGTPLLHLHGKQKQPKRMTVFADFNRKKSAVLIATDIAARGLDFPAVDWVLQVDCPEDVETYVHRVGRTARYESTGNSLLFLLSSEREMIRLLRDTNKFAITSYQNRNEEKEAQPRLTVRPKLQALCSQDPEIKYLGQKALISYVRSIHLHKDKRVFSVQGQPFDDFAISLGLPGAPKLRFIERQSALKNANRDVRKAISDSEDDVNAEVNLKSNGKNERIPIRAIDKMFLKKNTNVLSEHYSNLRADSAESETEILTVKRRDTEIDIDEFQVKAPGKQSRRDLLKTKKKYRLKSDERRVKLVFDEETGEAREALPFQPEADFDQTDIPKLSRAYLESTGAQLASVDIQDKDRVKRALRERKQQKKKRDREEVLGTASKHVTLGNENE